MKVRVAVTGADGFVGTELCNVARQRGYDVLAIGRHGAKIGSPALDDAEGWQRILTGVDVVVHLAGRAHVLRESALNPLDEFRKVNVAGTLCIARAAVSAQVPRLIFVSSIGVLGNDSGEGIFSEQSTPRPIEPYAVSKHEAELALRTLESETGLEVAIVRPPLIYGPRVKGNFARLLSWVAAGIPLPLGSVRNRRSFIGVSNVSDLLLACAESPLGNERLFVVSDGEDVSTPQLLDLLAARMGRRSRVFPFPTGALRSLAALAGRDAEYRRLAGNLVVDGGLARRVLNWRPATTLEAGLEEMAQWFVKSRQ